MKDANGKLTAANGASDPPVPALFPRDGEPEIITGLADVADRYDALILDLWGVLHNGVHPFPRVIDGLQQLRSHGKWMCILSNAPARAAQVAERMDAIGLSPNLVDDIVSAGEAAYQALADAETSPLKRWGRRCYFIGGWWDLGLVQIDGVSVVDRIEDADFILCAGIESEDETIAHHAPTLDRGLARRLPFVCANPDMTVVVGDVVAMCAGMLARYYEERGGEVLSFGKPHAAVYETCLARLGVPPRSRVLAVGDTLETDIDGAAALGIDSVLVATGVLADALMAAPGEDGVQGLNLSALRRLTSSRTYRPRYACQAFCW